MAKDMLRKHVPPAEKKMMLLYIIKWMGALERNELDRFILENQLLEYIDAHLLLDQLVDAGLLLRLESEGMLYHLLTDAGRDCIEHMGSTLAYSIRKNLETTCADWRAKFRREKMIFAQYSTHARGCAAELYMLDEGVELIRLRIELGSVAAAKAVCARWREDPAGTYTRLLDALGVEQG